MRKQYALEIDFCRKHCKNKKQTRTYRSCSSLDLEDQIDTSTFRTHPVFFKPNVACRKENLLTRRKIHFENITQANEFIFSTYSCWSKLVIVCPNISEVNMKSKLEWKSVLQMSVNTHNTHSQNAAVREEHINYSDWWFYARYYWLLFDSD